MKTRVPFWVRCIEGENASAAAASVDNEAAKGADSSGAAQAQDADDSSGADPDRGAESTAEHWKAQARKRERRAKDNQAAAETLKKLEDTAKSG